MANALIGATGFVGGNLPPSEFEFKYNSANIEEIRGKSFDLVVCSGAPAAKWKANQEPAADLANLERLMAAIADVRATRFLLVSTVDVFHTPLAVDESSPVEPDRTQPYGRHRFLLERFVGERFPHACTVRLPGLFGRGLKKNIIFDLIHSNALHLTDAASVFQFYHLDRLWSDLQRALDAELKLVHFATEPVQVAELARRCFGVEFTNRTPAGPVRYDLRTAHAATFGGEGHYLYSADETFSRIRQFAESAGAA